jgi:hypothetical protein
VQTTFYKSIKNISIKRPNNNNLFSLCCSLTCDKPSSEIVVVAPALAVVFFLFFLETAFGLGRRVEQVQLYNVAKKGERDIC